MYWYCRTYSLSISRAWSRMSVLFSWRKSLSTRSLSDSIQFSSLVFIHLARCWIRSLSDCSYDRDIRGGQSVTEDACLDYSPFDRKSPRCVPQVRRPKVSLVRSHLVARWPCREPSREPLLDPTRVLSRVRPKGSNWI